MPFDPLCETAGILLPYGKHFHERITLLSGPGSIEPIKLA